MGACNFADVGIAKTSTEAYNKAVEQAEYDCGHDPYNGTISTTCGHKMYKNAPEYGTPEFNDFEEEKLDNDLHKWDVAGCVEVTGEKAINYKRMYGYADDAEEKVFYFFGWAAE